MKKIGLFILFAFFIQTNVSSWCLPNGIIFNSQSQIDDFLNNYPNCYDIRGTVTISGNDITNLNGLKNINRINTLIIRDNPSLTSLKGLDSLRVLTGYYGLVIENNPSLTDLSALNNLEDAAYILFIANNDALTNLSGLNNLSEVHMYITISDNASLIDLSGLEGITNTGHLSIYDNSSLQTLKGLDNLEYLGYELSIWNNTSLTNIKDLKNLNELGLFDGNNKDDLSIYNNSSLTSLEGLDNLLANSIYNLNISTNISLLTCHVKSICDYLASPNGTIEIHNNATGCNTHQEVEDACANIGVSELDSESVFAIYPNPAMNEFFISGKNGAKVHEVNIYNQIGQRVMHETRVTSSINVSMLKQGLYTIELISEEFVKREKLIIE